MDKLSANLPGVHGLKSLSSTGRRSIPPSSKSAYLDLYMRKNEKDRLEKARKQLEKNKNQIDDKLAVINKGMAELLKIATADDAGIGNQGEDRSKSRRHMVLEY